MLLSKRVNNYQCMFIADFSGESCMYPDLTCHGTQLGQWIDYLHLQWWAEITFFRASACKSVGKSPIFKLGTISQHPIVVKNPDLR